MWGYIKKIIQFSIFTFLLEGVAMVGYLSFDGMVKDEFLNWFEMAICMVPTVMASFGILSLLRTQRLRLRSRYEKDAISTRAMVVLNIVMVIVVIGVALGAAWLANYLYNVV